MCVAFITLLNVISQLTGEISHLKLGLLKEGFGHPNSEADVDELVRSSADRLGRETGATVEEVSVKMHYDGIQCTILLSIIFHTRNKS